MVKEVVARVSRLLGSGAQLWVEGDRLRYRGPAGLLTNADERFFTSHRDQIVKVINAGVLVRCLACGGPALTKPDERWDDPRYNDLWQGRCDCGTVFSTSNIASEMVN